MHQSISWLKNKSMIKSTSAQSVLPEKRGLQERKEQNILIDIDFISAQKSRKSWTKQHKCSDHYSKFGDCFFSIVTSTYTDWHKGNLIAYSKLPKLSGAKNLQSIPLFAVGAGSIPAQQNVLSKYLSHRQAQPDRDAGEVGTPDANLCYQDASLRYQCLRYQLLVRVAG